MNENNGKQKTLNPEWQQTIREIIDIALKLPNGEIIIKIQEGVPFITEYRIKRKPKDKDVLKVELLSE